MCLCPFQNIFSFSFFLFPEIPEPQLTLMTPWKDVFKGEFVQLYCNVDIPDWVFVWYRNGVQLQMDDAVTLHQDDPFLNISAATEEHQGDYSCHMTLESRGLRSRNSNTVTIEVYGKPL